MRISDHKIPSNKSFGYFFAFIFIAFGAFLYFKDFFLLSFFLFLSAGMFFLLIAILFQSIQKKSRLIFSIIISILIIFNFLKNLGTYQNYIYQPSKLHYVCVNKSTRDFYYHWARNFNEVFFKKICLNNNLLFK